MKANEEELMHVVAEKDQYGEICDERLAHERLDVYAVALEFLELLEPLLGKLPRTKGQLGDQLGRASESIARRIAEGAGAEWRSAEQKRYFRNARGSALECSSCLDVCRIRRIGSTEELAQGRRLLVRIVQMLTRLARDGLRCVDKAKQQAQNLPHR
jgi:four helix bundle protein